MTAFVDYQTLFPESDRHLLIANHPELPSDRYSLHERYYADPSCGCQRVHVEVVSVTSRTGLASICYAFTDHPDEAPDGRNPYLEPMAPQVRYAAELLDLVTNVIETDTPYRKRFKHHYREVKQFMVDHPEHDLHGAVATDRRAMQAPQPSERKSDRRRRAPFARKPGTPPPAGLFD